MELEQLELPLHSILEARRSTTPSLLGCERLLSPARESIDKDYRFVVVEGFLTKEEVSAVRAVGEDPAIPQVYDRNAEYWHFVKRFEHQMQDSEPDLFERVMRTTLRFDEVYWQRFTRIENRTVKAVQPEFEYIDYDTVRLGAKGSFSRHIDNDSVITVIIMLSEPEDFSGGLNYFALETANGDEHMVYVKPRLGDAIFFRGNKVAHGLDPPVTSGRRVVMQVEFTADLDWLTDRDDGEDDKEDDEEDEEGDEEGPEETKDEDDPDVDCSAGECVTEEWTTFVARDPEERLGLSVYTHQLKKPYLTVKRLLPGPIVVAVAQGSSAIREGDRIVAINGVEGAEAMTEELGKLSEKGTPVVEFALERVKVRSSAKDEI